MADLELLLVPWLAATLGVRAVTEVPGTLSAAVPLLRVARVGGADDDNDPKFDAPTISIDWFGMNRQAASDLATAGHLAMRVTLPGKTLNGSTITFVQTISGPSWRPWDDTDVRRYGSTYRLHVKS